MKGRESQISKCYRMLMAGATTNDFCEDHRLRNNWRARKTEIGNALKVMYGVTNPFYKEKLPTDDGDPENYYYKISLPGVMPDGDPLGMFSIDTDADKDIKSTSPLKRLFGTEEDGQTVML